MPQDDIYDPSISHRDFIRLSGGAIAATGAAGLAGCGGGGGGDAAVGAGGSGVSSFGTMADTTRAAIYNNTAAFVGTLAHTDLAGDAVKIQTYLKGIPQVDLASVDGDGNVWAHFSDGIIFGVFNNMVPSIFSSKSATSLPALKPPSPGRSAEIPTGLKANLFCTSGQRLTPTADVIAPWLTNAGYTVNVNTSVGVEDLKLVDTSAGMFFIDAHGALIPTAIINSKSAGSKAQRGIVFATVPLSFVLSTSTLASADSMPMYAADVKAARLFSAIATTASFPPAPNNNVIQVIPKPVWCITEKFVTQYTSFSANSLVFLNCCSGYNTPIIAAVTAKGSATYIGYTAQIGDTPSYGLAQLIFDELVGANVYLSSTPQQRPFDWPSIYADLKSRGLINPDPIRPKSTLMYTPTSTESAYAAILTPSISNLTIVGTTFGTATSLSIKGNFGAQPASGASVTIYPGSFPAPGVGGTGTSLAITTWTPTQITCSLPTGGGDVIVSANGHTSNPRRLTEWRGTIDYSGSGPDSHAESFSIQIHILADVESYRTEPNELLSGENALLVPATFLTMPDAYCSYMNSGTADSKFTDWTWTGGGPVPPGQNPGFSYSGTIDPAGKTLSLYFAVNTANNVMVEYKDSNRDDNGGGTSGLVMSVANFPSHQTSGGLGAISFGMDANLNIVAGSISDSITKDYGLGNDGTGDGTLSTTLSWSIIPPVGATVPNPDAARSATSA